eukprot:8127494-Karenia_brevis.AAC.1
MPDNKFRDESEEEEEDSHNERELSDRSDSSSSTPPTPERRPPIGAPRDFKREVVKKEEIPMDD